MGGGDHSEAQGREMKNDTISHTAAGVYACAAPLKEVSLGLIRTAANARPTVLFCFFSSAFS